MTQLNLDNKTTRPRTEDGMSIGELSNRIRTKELSPVELINGCLARIDELNPRLNAFITVLGEQARDQAKQAEAEIKAGEWRGPLHGVPVAIKDFYDTAGIKTTAAFEKFKDRVPKNDAIAVAKLRKAGAIVVGKTNMHQLGMGTTGLESYFGPVQNPWNAEYIPGGSSSGSAAAVATGLCCATVDTDAIGSCRLPAACCGVVGFKGTYGLISLRGVLEGEKTEEAILWLSHPGITTRRADDTAIVLSVLAEKTYEFHGDVVQERRVRIGVANNFKADTEVSGAFGTAVETLRTLGHEIVEASAPFDMPPFGDLRTIEKDRKTIADRAFKGIDVLLLPTTATTVLRVKAAAANPQALSPANTVFANYFGLPAISTPCGFDGRGLPIGLQIVGKPGDDAAVLRLARQYETATGTHRKHPIA
jgi:aspartyl-tRNA(Asn)/glutamyl-tRNA(Gln) amidotransferase subunit A